MAKPLQRRISSDQENLRMALDLLRRGKKTMQRTGWEKGETDEQWCSAVTSFFTMLSQDAEMARMVTERKK